MGFRCLRQRRARRGSPAAPGGVLLDAMYLRGPGYATTPSASCGRCSEGAVGCAAEPLPAAETGEAEQGQTQRPHPVDEIGSCVWRSGLNMQASSLMRRIFRAPQEERRPNVQAGRAPRRIFGQRQPGAALRFLQAPSAVRRKNRLSARVETFSGAAGGARTRGLLFPKQVRFQLRYSDMERAEAVNFFRASAMAMADKRPFASGCPHEKGPRSVVGACPSAGPLPGDLPASGRGVFSGGPWQPKKKPPARMFLPRLRLSQVHYTMPGI